MQTPPPYLQHLQPQMPPPPGPTPDERALRIAAEVNSALVTKLAPFVELTAGAMERVVPKGNVILRAPPPGGPLRAHTRKILVFDPGARGTLSLALAVSLGMLWVAAVGLLVFIARGRWQGLAVVGAAALVAIGMCAMSVFSAAARVRQVRRQVARSLVVPGRIASATRHINTNRRAPGLGSYDLLVDYWHGGAWHRMSRGCNDREFQMVGWTPDLLLDTEGSGGVLFKDLYV